MLIYERACFRLVEVDLYSSLFTPFNQLSNLSAWGGFSLDLKCDEFACNLCLLGINVLGDLLPGGTLFGLPQ
ncbi:hypothetical protein D3C85_1084340 [compost metagenome]